MPFNGECHCKLEAHVNKTADYDFKSGLNMDNSKKFLLPTPNFNTQSKDPPKTHLHFLTPSGMTLLPRERQPPPMYGPKGATVPPKFLTQIENTNTQPPERHFCEPCEMELQSQNDLRRHRTQHERCPVDGCKYKAHPSVMDKHVTELHASGIFEKIKKLSTPEEIAAWRDERRRKYPTLANVQQKQLVKEQRQKRGERLEESKARFGRREDRKRAHDSRDERQKRECDQSGIHQRKNFNNRNKFRKQDIEKTAIDKHTKTGSRDKELKEAEIITSCSIPMFKGTGIMKDYYREKTKKQSKKNALSCLVGMYGSDDDESTAEGSNIDESDEESTAVIATIGCKSDVNGLENQQISSEEIQLRDDIPSQNIISKDTTEMCPSIEQTVKKTEENVELLPESLYKETYASEFVQAEKVICQTQSNLRIDGETNNESSDEAPEEMPIERTEILPEATPNNALSATVIKSDAATESKSSNRGKIQDVTRKRKYGLDYRKTRLRKQNTMLEKLLQADIRHERNVLLQCVRFVCENNFFDIGTNKITASTDQ